MINRDWVLGDIVWAIMGMAVVLGLVVLNEYVQRLSRIEEEDRQLKLAGSNPLNRHRSLLRVVGSDGA